MNEEQRTLFLALKEKTERAFKEYADSMLALNNSNLDPLLRQIMDQKNHEYQNAFNEFQSRFPMHDDGRK